jgi:hypothetical protein
MFFRAPRLRRLTAALVIGAAAWALLPISGCGGGATGLTATQQPADDTGRATIVVNWPTAPQSRLIPAGTNSILVTIENASSTVVASSVIVRTATGLTTTVTIPSLPVGNLTVMAQTFQTTTGTGSPTASATGPLVIAAGKNTTFTLTLASLVSTLTVTPASNEVYTGASYQLSIAAADASGNNVPLVASEVTLASDNTNVATVTQAGVVTTVGAGTAHITVTDTDGGKTATSTVICDGPPPVALYNADGNALDSVGGNNGVPYGNVSYGAGLVSGQAFEFAAPYAAVNIGDVTALQITGSLTIDCYAEPTALPSASQVHSEVVFRGDNRVGYDPYYLSLDSDGNWHFQICDSNNDSVEVSAPATLNQIAHLTGVLNATTGTLSLYVNGTLADQTTTTIRPFAMLNSGSDAGVAIGNVFGAPNPVFNYTFYGAIDEVKIYNQAVPPTS